MDWFIAPFRFDVTPPLGHPLCGGWIKPVLAVDDPLEAIGFVLLGPEAPVVVCAVDWCSILNETNLAWRKSLAEAAHTTPDRVAVHTVHQHNAPFACIETEKILAAQGDLTHTLDLDFHQRCLDKARAAVGLALKKTRRVTHIGVGKGRVEQVASNRRHLGPDGKMQYWRASSCADPKIRDLPEGLIDPWLRTVAFFEKDQRIVACHYYATHPMSYYGDGRVTSDFVGLARKQRQQDDPGCIHLYFTGGAGNVAAGKYNDGSKEARPRLVERMYRGIVESEKATRIEPIAAATWRTRELSPPPRKEFTEESLMKQMIDKNGSISGRSRPAFVVAWRRRLAGGLPVPLSALIVNDVTLLHLPSESFIEYQLKAQALAPKRFVATAAYGDGGPWYIPTADAYSQGGYEVSVAFADPAIDDQMTAAIRELVAG